MHIKNMLALIQMILTPGERSTQDVSAPHRTLPLQPQHRAQEYYELWRKQQSPEWIETPRPDAWWFNFAADFAGETKGGLLALQLLPCDMPEPLQPIGAQMTLEELHV